MFSDFLFLRPAWLLILVPALFLIWLLARANFNSKSNWESQIDSALLPYLLQNPNASRHGFKWLLTLFISCLFATIALAGPVWKTQKLPVHKKSDALVIVADMSLSMYSQDVLPTRLERIRFKLIDLLEKRKEGTTALIVYAGDSHLVSPLTDDSNTLINFIPALKPEIMPIFGSQVGPALQMAIDLLDQSAVDSGHIFLITDGIDQPSEFIQTVKNSNYILTVLGIGTSKGAPIYMPNNNSFGYLRGANGELIIPTLDHDNIKSLVEAAGGSYHSFDSSSKDIDFLLETNSAYIDANKEAGKEFSIRIDQGYLLLFLCIPGLLFLFRKGLLYIVVLTLTMQFMPLPVYADWWADLWHNDDQQGYDLIQKNMPNKAAQKFNNPDWQASAYYLHEDYAAAAQIWGQDKSANGRFNLGNALAFKGQLIEAINAYAEALSLNPEHKDAAFNRKLLEKLLKTSNENKTSNGTNNKTDGPKQQEQSSQPQQEDRQTSSRQDSQQAPQDTKIDQNTAEQQFDEATNSFDQKQPEQQNSKANAIKAEQQQDESTPTAADAGQQDKDEELSQQDELDRQNKQSLQQWLRRVPDNPGELLKRKFKYESQQKKLNGKQLPREEKIW